MQINERQRRSDESTANAMARGLNILAVRRRTRQALRAVQEGAGRRDRPRLEPSGPTAPGKRRPSGIGSDHAVPTGQSLTSWPRSPFPASG
jgi:hypothetical protein